MQLETLSIATSILILVCFFAPMLFRKELKAKEDKYYLFAFYAGVLVHFLTVFEPSPEHKPLLDITRTISVTNGVLLPFWLSAFICKRDKEVSLYNVLILMVFLNLTVQFLYHAPVYLSVFFACSSNFIGLVALLKNHKNKADTGLAFCFLVITFILFIVLIEAPFDITPYTFYQNYYSWLLVFIPAFICGSTMFIFLRYVIELNIQLSEIANYDVLTKVPNRRYAFGIIHKQLSNLSRRNSYASVVMADLDHFKKVNDTYGHSAGDEVIKAFANIILSNIRDFDVVCRYGGEEFLIFFPDTDAQQASLIAERIRESLCANEIIFKGQVIGASASFGVSNILPEQSLNEAIDEADSALYTSKCNGRNKTTIFEPIL
ncbi:GGDEF domain-containing protein [Pseudoalteromonas peptidolytica]|uniref:GGDEF domain-containing protein n=1 Tax=Pseudoalteromonas peptidolytica TaxID=61150 RepID=UPI00298E1243|nr:GGDEF domain-containing protein [Pseudoalteromonas peptidolytica]MDW7550398.1 GGDEF domain-containing protein [Pseudoalteromonas peptidolytica]